MLPIRTVLHPTNFSEHSDYAFRLASSLARDYGARLIVLHVLERPVLTYAGVITAPPPPSPSAERRQSVQEQLHRIKPPHAAICVEHLLEEGDPATAILQVAQERQCELILMGSHGRRGLGRLLMGSVAEQVVRKASCLVLTVKILKQACQASLGVSRAADEIKKLRPVGAVLRVKDTGMGIPANMLSSIFDPFVQAEGTVERSESGLGIGLALVRRLVELHGGKIAAESAVPDRGSEFRVRLPARSARPVGKEVPLPESADASLPSPASRRILIVDDNLDSAECFAAWLKLNGHEVFVAADGPTALDVLPDFHPDVLISDIRMPGMDGCELARRIKEQPAMQHVLLVAITGLGQESDRQRCLEAGFDLHLVKPIEPSELQALVVNPQLISKRLDRRATALPTFAQGRWD